MTKRRHSGVALPQFIRWIVDTGIGGRDTGLLALAAGALLALTLVKGILTFFQMLWTEQASQGVAYDQRNAIHSKLATLSFSYHDRTETGQALSRAVQDVERVRFLTGRAFLRLADAAVLIVGSGAVLVWMNPQLALLALATLPLQAPCALAQRFCRVHRACGPLTVHGLLVRKVTPVEPFENAWKIPV